MKKLTSILGLMTALVLCNLDLAMAQSVDMLTGKLQMSVPLGGLSGNDISVPIAVFNYGQSLPTAVGEGECGLGWGLSVGGGVSRIVRGLPDEINTSKKGWLHSNAGLNVQSFTPSADDDLSDCTDEASDVSAINNLFAGYFKDTEPDLFYINAPGLSAQFIFGPDGSPRLLIHQDITVLYYGDSIVVKNNQGLVYQFATKETSTRRSHVANNNDLNTACNYYLDGEFPFTSQWKLTSIRSQATGTKALFNYVALQDEAGRYIYSLDSTNYIIDKYSRQQLTSITLRSFVADFTWRNSLLQRVVIRETTTLEKQEFNLEYRSAAHQTTFTYHKAFLSGIQILSGNCTTFDRYSFEYQNVTLSATAATIPSHVKWGNHVGQDYFGYPNGRLGNFNLPTLHAYYSESDGRRLRVATIPGLTPSTLWGNDRSPDITKSYGALSKVIVPTGGSTSIEYEANAYFDNSTSQELTGGGLRVKKLISQGGEAPFGKTINASNSYRAVVKQYEYLNTAGTQSSGLLAAPITLGYISSSGIKQSVRNIGDDDPVVLYSRVKEKITGQGSTVYEFSVPGVFPETSFGDWKASKSRIARSKVNGVCPAEGNVKNGYYIFPYAPSSNYSFRRGQLSKVTDYSETGTAIREKTLTYTRRTTNPSVIKGLRFEKIGNIFHYGVYEIITGNVELILQEVVKESSQVDPTKWFQTTTAYVYKSNHMVDSVTTTSPDNTITSKRFKYAADFPFSSPAASDTAATAIKSLNDTNRGSALIEQTTRIHQPGANSTLVDAQLIVYRTNGARTLPYHSRSFPKGFYFTHASMSGQTFVSDTDYKTTSIIKEYDGHGRILTLTDDKRNYVASHYAKDASFQLATFSNMRAQQAVYEGFEMASQFGLTATGTGIDYPEGWTGQKAIRFTNSSAKLESSSVTTILKNGNSYRVSCWVYAPANKTITFQAKNGGSVAATVNLINAISNKWNYLEAEMNTSSANSSFTLEVTTNASVSETIVIDDIVFMPSSARVSLQTNLPFKGSTSSTDDLGNSVKNIYDAMGRVVSVLDQNRNLVQKNEYFFQNTKAVEPPVSFEPNVQQYFVNAAISFTPDLWGCSAETTYAWEVDGVAKTAGAGHVLSHTFTSAGPHSVKLTVTSNGVSRSYTQTYCVEYQLSGTFSVLITDQNGSPITSFDCNSQPTSINLTLVPPTGFPQGCLSGLAWTESTAPDGAGGTIVTHTASFTVNCDAYKDCAFSSIAALTGAVQGSYQIVYNPNCQ
jgi:hypothetical protein